MGNAYCAVRYTFAGRTYQTIHGLHSTLEIGPVQNTFSAADLEEWGFNALATGDLEARTSISNSPFNYANLIEGILAMHRFMQSTMVRLTQVYISDGMTPGLPTGNFATFDINLQCQAAHVSGTKEFVAPANNALLIDKTAGQFSRRGGRMWLRGAMNKGDYVAEGDDGVMLLPSAATALQAHLQDFLNTETVGGVGGAFKQYFGFGADGAGPTASPVQYSIPKTTGIVIDGKKRRVLQDWTRVGTLSVQDAQSRDTRRRGPRKTA